MPPSKKRRVLALYVDYLLFSALFTPAAWLFQRLVEVTVPMPVWPLAFVLVKTAFWPSRRSTAGDRALGIRGGQEVDARILSREVWWTMLAGTLLVRFGAKDTFAWTEGRVAIPVFGMDATLTACLVACLGFTQIMAGLHVLRTDRRGAQLGCAAVSLTAGIMAVKAFALREWVEFVLSSTPKVDSRRLPFARGIIDAGMDSLVLIIPVTILLVVLIITGRRFGRLDAEPRQLEQTAPCPT